jgi:hypothetical protein
MNIEQNICQEIFIDIENASFYGGRGFRVVSWRAGVHGGWGRWHRRPIGKEIP